MIRLLDHLSYFVSKIVFLLLDTLASLVTDNINDLDRTAELLSLFVNVLLN